MGRNAQTQTNFTDKKMSGEKMNSVHISFEMKILFEMKFHTVVKSFLFIGFYEITS